MNDSAPTLFGPRRPGRPANIKIAGQLAEGLRAAEHLEPMDRPLAELARRLARDIDGLEPHEFRALAALSAQLVAVLDRLLMTPKARRGIGMTQETDEPNPLTELALIRNTRRAGQPDTGT